MIVVLSAYITLFVIITLIYPIALKYSYQFEKVEDITVANTPFTNAWTSGLFKPNIVVSALLVEILSEDELSAIILHEKGHFQKRHIWKSLLINILKLTIIVMAFGFLIPPLWLAIITPIAFLATRKVFDQTAKHEFEADEYVASHNMAYHMVSALRKISDSDLTELRILKLMEYDF